MTPIRILPLGTTLDIIVEITSPTPASVNRVPKAPKSCGKRQDAPTCISCMVVFSRVSFTFGRQMITARTKDTRQAIPTITAPSSAAPSILTNDITSAIRPTVTAGRNIQLLIRLLSFSFSSTLTSRKVPIRTCPLTVKIPITTRIPPVIVLGIHFPRMKITPTSTQNSAVPYFALSFFRNARQPASRQTSPHNA